MNESSRVPGGGFLIHETAPPAVFTPEDFSEEHRMIFQTARDFMEREVYPRQQQIEHQQPGLTEELLRKAAEIGLLAVSIPEKYGGLGLDQTSAILVSEATARQASFAVSIGGHTSIGTLPIVYFGTEEQKRKYLPRLASGELLSSYALSEAGSGSDALAAKAKAVLSPDGREWVLNGEKMWITNAAFADLFITFAQVDGDKFSCFIVERGFPGVSVGAEERKLGIKGSSTRVLKLNEARVPVDNLLGEIGKGHRIAFNILNIGRYKLGATCAGGCKIALTDAVRYANQRQQFGRPIASFGLIQSKLGWMALDAWVSEAMVYRTAGLIEAILRTVDKENPSEVLRGIEEYAVECSIIKVYATEALDRVVDETVQIFGGNGYSAEYPAERYYRDARINRIFEGTNEINRLLIPGMLMKRAIQGRLPLLQAAGKVRDELLALPAASVRPSGPLGAERALVGRLKKAVLLVAGVAAQRFGAALEEQQEILGHLADMTMEVYAAESALLRALKAGDAPGADRRCWPALVQLAIHRATEQVEHHGRRALCAVAEGDELRVQLAALKRLVKQEPVNVVALARAVAAHLIEADRYTL